MRIENDKETKRVNNILKEILDIAIKLDLLSQELKSLLERVRKS